MHGISMGKRYSEYRWYALIAWLYLAVTWTLDAVHTGNGWDIAASVVAVWSFIDLAWWAILDRRDRQRWRREFAGAIAHRTHTLWTEPGGNTSNGGDTD